MNRGQIVGICVLWITFICFCAVSYGLIGGSTFEGAIMVGSMVPPFFYFAWVIIGLLGVE